MITLSLDEPRLSRPSTKCRTRNTLRPLGSDGTTIRELCERYEREFKPVYLKKSTAANYHRLIRDHLIPTFGDRHQHSHGGLKTR